MPQKYTVLVLCLFFVLGAHAQDTAGASSKIYTYVEQMPVAGYDYNKYLFEHISHTLCSDTVFGKIIVKFIVNEDGHVSDCKIIKGVGGCWDSEVLMAVENFPAWKPGKKDGSDSV